MRSRGHGDAEGAESESEQSEHPPEPPSAPEGAVQASETVRSRAPAHELAAPLRASMAGDPDTEADPVPPFGAEGPRARRAPAAPGEESSARPARSAPVLRGPGVPREAQLRPARTTHLRIREAVVRLQNSPTQVTPSAPRASAPVEVVVDWVRSSDPGQKVARLGRDGLQITGTASQDGAHLSVGVDGHLFRVPLTAGDLPTRTVERLAERLGARFELRTEATSAASASLRLIGRL